MRQLVIIALSSIFFTSLQAQSKSPAKEEQSTSKEVQMEETIITPLNVPEDDMFRLPEDANPSLLAKKKKLVTESSKLTKYSEEVSNFIQGQDEAVVSDADKTKLNKLLENYTTQLNLVEQAEDDFLTELIEYNRIKEAKLPMGETVTDKDVKKMRQLDRSLPNADGTKDTAPSH